MKFNKNNISSRLIYLSGRSNPERLQSVCFRILSELENHLLSILPYKSISRDRAIRNWIAQSEGDVLQLIRLMLENNSLKNNKLISKQDKIISVLPKLNAEYWLLSELIHKNKPSLEQSFEQLSHNPLLLTYVILNFYKNDYPQLNDLIGPFTKFCEKNPKEGVKALKLFHKHIKFSPFTEKEINGFGNELAKEILFLYSPSNNRYHQEIVSNKKIIDSNLLKKYKRNRSFSEFTYEFKKTKEIIEEIKNKIKNHTFNRADFLNTIKFNYWEKIRISTLKNHKLRDLTGQSKYKNADEEKYLSKIKNKQYKEDYIFLFSSPDEKIDYILSQSWYKRKILFDYLQEDELVEYYRQIDNQAKIKFLKNYYKNKAHLVKAISEDLINHSDSDTTSVIFSILKNKKWKSFIQETDYYYSKRIQDDPVFFDFIIKDDLISAAQYVDGGNLQLAINHLNSIKYQPKRADALMILFKKIASAKTYDEDILDFSWIEKLNNLEQYSKFIKYYFENDLNYSAYKIILERLFKSEQITKNYFYSKNDSLISNSIQWLYEKIDQSAKNIKKLDFLFSNNQFLNDLFLYDQVLFWEKILNSKQLSKKRKNKLILTVNTKNHIDSLLLNSKLSKYYKDQEIVKKLALYLKRSDLLKDQPGIRASYLLSMRLGLSQLPIFLSLFKKIEYTHSKENSGILFDDLYRTYEIPKKSGGKRTITVPHKYLKSLQKLINQGILYQADLSSAATGFRKNTSIVDNAKIHTGNKIVVNIDISNFFPNTKTEWIWLAFKKLLKNSYEACEIRLLTEICSYNGALPMGAPTSPALSNLVLKSADKAIIKVTKRKKINYSRYADDLTFSSNSSSCITILPFVQDVLKHYGYHLDPKKTNIFRKGRRQCVTGLVVNQKVSVPRPIRKRLRAAVHNACMNKPIHWHGKPMNINELKGRLAFLNQAHHEEAKLLISKLAHNKLV